MQWRKMKCYLTPKNFWEGESHLQICRSIVPFRSPLIDNITWELICYHPKSVISDRSVNPVANFSETGSTFGLREDDVQVTWFVASKISQIIFIRFCCGAISHYLRLTICTKCTWPQKWEPSHPVKGNLEVPVNGVKPNREDKSCNWVTDLHDNWPPLATNWTIAKADCTEVHRLNSGQNRRLSNIISFKSISHFSQSSQFCSLHAQVLQLCDHCPVYS